MLCYICIYVFLSLFELYAQLNWEGDNILKLVYFIKHRQPFGRYWVWKIFFIKTRVEGCYVPSLLVSLPLNVCYTNEWTNGQGRTQG